MNPVHQAQKLGQSIWLDYIRALARPNVMVKVPATPQGIPAIRQLTGEGINVNVTLIFSLDVYEQVVSAYISGLEDMVRKGGDFKRFKRWEGG